MCTSLSTVLYAMNNREFTDAKNETTRFISSSSLRTQKNDASSSISGATEGNALGAAETLASKLKNHPKEKKAVVIFRISKGIKMPNASLRCGSWCDILKDLALDRYVKIGSRGKAPGTLIAKVCMEMRDNKNMQRLSAYKLLTNAYPSADIEPSIGVLLEAASSRTSQGTCRLLACRRSPGARCRGQISSPLPAR
ncbi:hypothetical protein COL516b_012678 [Colletotrichum fioriniae]|nr:uncharacterized protein COL516b_012678 [Colletotrichum fioriniae]KAJ0295330.1 hypothetical protein COL516b_012678 [Colletotrichum fioriniae]